MKQLHDGLGAAIAIAVCGVVIGGCGGGDDGNPSTSTPTTSDLPTITAPTTPPPAQLNQDAAPTGTAPASPDAAPPNRARFEQAMTPFFDCLSRHGVQPSPLTGTSLHGSEIRDPRLVRKEIHAKIACVPQLPEQLRAAGERFKQRFQQLYR